MSGDRELVAEAIAIIIRAAVVIGVHAREKNRIQFRGTGAKGDVKGRPFVGIEGDLVDAMVDDIDQADAEAFGGIGDIDDTQLYAFEVVGLIEDACCLKAFDFAGLIAHACELDAFDLPGGVGDARRLQTTCRIQVFIVDPGELNTVHGSAYDIDDAGSLERCDHEQKE